MLAEPNKAHFVKRDGRPCAMVRRMASPHIEVHLPRRLLGRRPQHRVVSKSLTRSGKSVWLMLSLTGTTGHELAQI